jgi:hypothetical protein
LDRARTFNCLILVALPTSKELLDFFQEFWKTILNSTVLVALAGLYLESRKRRKEEEKRAEEEAVKLREEAEKKEKDSIRSNVQIDGKLYPKLWQLLREYMAGRTFILQFHNGGCYFSGKGMKRATMSHEVSTYNLGRISGDFQGYVMSEAFHEGLREMMDLSYLYYPSIDKLPESGTKSMLRTYGSKSFFAVLFWDKAHQDPIGCLCLCFGKENPLTEEQTHDIIARSEDILHLVRD